MRNDLRRIIHSVIYYYHTAPKSAVQGKDFLPVSLILKNVKQPSVSDGSCVFEQYTDMDGSCILKRYTDMDDSCILKWYTDTDDSYEE